MGYLDTTGLKRFTSWIQSRLAGKQDREEAENTYLKKTGGTLPEDAAFLFGTQDGSVKFSLDPANAMSTAEDVAVISSGDPDMFKTGLFLGSGRCLLSSDEDQMRLAEFFLSGMVDSDGIHNFPVEISVTNYNDSTKSQIQIGDGGICQQIESGTGAEAHMLFGPDRVEMQLCEGPLLIFYDTGGGDGLLELNGDPVVTQSAIAGLSGVPSGVIVMWSGATTDIPAGWVLCNGDNGTPDLRDRFVVGAGNTYSVGAKGGEATHTLTVAEMPRHTHGVPTNSTTNGSYTTGYSVGAPNTKLAAGSRVELVNTASQGTTSSHNNMPPYYALCYIMKQ